MKRKLLFVALIGVLSACNNVTDESKETQNDTKLVETKNHVIQLNNGEKWHVNEEMKPHILAGEDALNLFIKSEDTNFLVLSEQLKNHNSALIKNCSMTGESHNELHNWLVPHMKLIERLSLAKEEEAAAIIIEELTDSFNMFHIYFN